ncbi:alanine/glycine:cation symporter family protein [Abyssisolibacter fermentans]|uniref:alanine/glycine:cation symporter family protein n=1 Tax=Abyssisolibacter fermentans TaxID=1766203 RepID=UPI00082B61A4|nr:sodium:alanine symporter family protein [Abyssisolibacter fermentans]
MERFEEIIKALGNFAWGPIMIVLLVGTGVLLSIGTKFIQFRKLGYAFKLLFSKDIKGEGDISPFQALMTSLAATIGTGNIAGVASAIAAGGPGAVFWMWVTAAFGGATKYAEALLALKYRITNKNGEKSGGPMYYLKLGFKDNFGEKAGKFGSIIGWMFAFFGFFASFGIGNMVQANSVSTSLNVSFGIDPKVSGVVITLATGLVIIGGIKSIGNVTDKVVPAMAIAYILGSGAVLIMNASRLLPSLSMIFTNAFSSKAVGGGVIGTVIRYGVARGVFSNEAGLGSAPIAHAASTNDDPVSQGIIGSLGSFIDTLIVCTMTALVILVSGLVNIDAAGKMTITNNLTSAALTTTAFNEGLPGFGGYIVSIGLVFFAFSTILGWFYYGSKCLEYIAGLTAVKIYKVFYILLCYVGALSSIDIVWDLSDAFNGLMAIPNLIGLVSLSGLVFTMTKDYKFKNKL